MDPLSITVSIIAIIGVGGQTAKTIKKLASIKGAPDSILALNNEISDIRLIIIAIQDVFEKQRTTGKPFPGYRASEANVDASVISALEQANKKVLELEALHNRLIPLSSGLSGLATTDRITWLREQKKLKHMQEDLRTTRLKLATALGVLNSLSSLRLESEIHSLQAKLEDLHSNQEWTRLAYEQRSVKGESIMQGLEDVMGDVQKDQKRLLSDLDQHSVQQASAIEALHSKLAELQSYQQRIEINKGQRLIKQESAIQERMIQSLEIHQRLELKLDLTEATSIAKIAQCTADSAMRPKSLASAHVTRSISISTSLSLTKCSDGCICICHRRQTKQTPKSLTSFLGALFIGYAGLPRIAQPCNVQDCIQRTSPTFIITYFFPSWLLARALFMVINLSSHDGPQFHLRFPRVMSNNSLIFNYAATGNVDGIKQILQQRLGSPFDVDTDTSYSPLMFAISFMKLEMCELLLKVGADPYQEDNLHRNSFDIVWDLILRKTGDANTRDRLGSLFPNEDYLEKYNFTLLHQTTLGLNNLDLTSLLASIPLSTVNKTDVYGRTAVWWTAAKGDLPSLALLINRGADIDKATHNRSHPLNIAICSKHDACVRLLMGSSTNLNYQDIHGWTPLIWCCYRGVSVDIVEQLILNGADIDACDIHGQTPLQMASRGNHVQHVRCLISHGADLNKKNINGNSPLSHAIQQSNIQVIQILLQYNADYSFKSNAGETLLHFAAQYTDVRSLVILRSFDLSCINVQDQIIGISPTQTLKGLIGLTALDIAERRTDVTPVWLETFRKLVHEVEFPESRASTNQDLEEMEEFEDTVENQE